MHSQRALIQACRLGVLLLLALPAVVPAQFTFTTNTGAITITGYTGSSGVVMIPGTITELPVTSIGNRAFFATRVTNVLIADSVISIGHEAFSHCGSLTNVTLGSSVTSIDNSAFGDCPKLESVCCRGNAPRLGGRNVFKSSPATIYYLSGATGWSTTFGGCPTVLWNPEMPYNYTTNDGTITIMGYTGSGGAVTIPSSINFLPVTSIGDWAFYLSSITNVLIPDSVTSIGEGACYGCTNLVTITFPSSVSGIGEDAFNGCVGLIAIFFEGNAPTFVGPYAFYGVINVTAYYFSGATGWDSPFAGPPIAEYACVTNNGAITITGYFGLGFSVVVPSEIHGLPVTSIGDSVFMSTGNLTNVAIGANVAHIGRLTFYDCFSLVSLTGLDNVTSIEDQAFEFCKNITSISISESATKIGIGVFANCSSLTNFTIPSKVTAIKNDLFLNCTKLIRVTMGSQVTSIGDYSFYGCTSLTNITLPNTVTSIGDYVFYNCTNLNGIFFTGNAPSIGGSFIFFNATNVTVYYLPGTKGWEATFGGRPTALWLPAMQTSDAGFGVQMNQFGFNIQWASGQMVVVDASTDLINWQPVQTNTLPTGSAYFSDPQWTNYPGRFYRLRAP